MLSCFENHLISWPFSYRKDRATHEYGQYLNADRDLDGLDIHKTYDARRVDVAKYRRMAAARSRKDLEKRDEEYAVRSGI